MKFDFSDCKTRRDLEIAIYSATQELIFAVRESCDVSVEMACYIIRGICGSTLEDRLESVFQETY